MESPFICVFSKYVSASNELGTMVDGKYMKNGWNADAVPEMKQSSCNHENESNTWREARTDSWKEISWGNHYCPGLPNSDLLVVWEI